MKKLWSNYEAAVDEFRAAFQNEDPTEVAEIGKALDDILIVYIALRMSISSFIREAREQSPTLGQKANSEEVSTDADSLAEPGKTSLKRKELCDGTESNSDEEEKVAEDDEAEAEKSVNYLKYLGKGAVIIVLFYCGLGFIIYQTQMYRRQQDQGKAG